MKIIGKDKLIKIKRKNIGNLKLLAAIDEFIDDLGKEIDSFEEFSKLRKDLDKVHNDGYYFFNLNVHRVFVQIDFDESEAEIVWIGTHDEYETTFKNNKNTIEKWLRSKGFIN